MKEHEWNTYIDLCEKDVLKANNYRHSLVPNILYKYYPLFDDKEESKERLNSVRQGKLWMSTHKSLNDPIDLTPFYLDEEKLRKRNYPSELIELLDSFLNGFAKDTMVICSFTTNSLDSMLMWAHYANNHKGFCVAYEVKNPKYMWDVHYQKRRLGISGAVTNLIYDDSSDENRRGKYAAILLQQALVKGKDWEYEHEYRIIQYKDNFPEFNEYGGLVNATFAGVKALKIVAGWKCAYKNQLSEIARELNCQISTVKPSKREFRMEEEYYGSPKV